MISLILKVFAGISALEMMTLSTPISEIICVLRKAHVPKIINRTYESYLSLYISF